MIEIRAMQPEDCEFIESVNRGKDENFLHQWAGPDCYTFPLTSEQIRKRLIHTEDTLFFAILNDGRMIGNVELASINNQDKSCRVCRFLIDEKNRNNGYGREALNQLLDIAFGRLKLDKVLLTVFDFNKNAIACYKKAGFEMIEQVQRPNGWKAIIMEKKKPRSVN